MKKHILVTGISGSGKTTLAKQLQAKTGLPLIELDSWDLAWKSGDYETGAREGVRKALALDAPHIIEGQGIMRMEPAELEGHELILVRPSDEVIFQRRLIRSTQKHGVDLDPDLYKQKVQNLIENDAKNLDKLEQSFLKPKIFKD